MFAMIYMQQLDVLVVACMQPVKAALRLQVCEPTVTTFVLDCW